MDVELTRSGELIVKSENELEAYALRVWMELYNKESVLATLTVLTPDNTDDWDK
jgi:hypothetical protein